jgi:F0F1-type ATP synthase assembly protein I
MTKSVILISVIGMLAGLLLCISAADSNIWFVVGFSLFLGNMSMFYLFLKRHSGIDPK